MNKKKPKSSKYFEDLLTEERNKNRKLKQDMEFMKKIYRQKRDELNITIRDLKNDVAHLKKKK